jgi:ADP-dependent NAD(P)H-hydrate dehydratase
MEHLDRAWLQRHPLPAVAAEGDKNTRGRVLVVGGAEFVPGALRLTGEAALRAGAGKLGLATVETAAISLGVNVPEASMLKLPADENGRIAPSAAEKIASRLKLCDTLVFGPGMPGAEETEELVMAVLRATPTELTVVLDAGALTACAKLAEAIAARSGRTILTPHRGEICRLTGLSEDEVAGDPETVAQDTARTFGAVVALKGEKTVLASPDGACARFEGGSRGLATSGSGDVLAGLIGGFAARGAPPLTAAGWGVFVHGTAGERASAEIAEIGFLARELLPRVPGIVAELSGG